MKPSPGYGPLRSHRVTIPQASYFVTHCTHERLTGLNKPAAAGPIKNQFEELEKDAALRIQAVVIMTDHLHVLFIATGKLTVGQIVGRLKSKTRHSLLAAGLGWQSNFYEHRMRAGDLIEDVLRYIFLNPYRASLLSAMEQYPWFWLGPAEAEWFFPTVTDKRPFPEWLK